MLLLGGLCLIGASGGLCLTGAANDGFVDLPVSLAAFFSLANSFSSSLACTNRNVMNTDQNKKIHADEFCRLAQASRTESLTYPLLMSSAGLLSLPYLLHNIHIC